jgi:UDP-galactopyranose mutase
VEELIEKFKIRHFTCWYYSPLALSFTGHLQPEVIIYDCMDELSAFRFAPKELKRMETLLLDRTDIVFTGGRSLYEARQHLHPNIHCFPSSIDKEHFAKARERQADPEDMRNIPHPRIGFYGVIDERFNMSLLQQLATHHPEWHFIIVGPTAKIDPEKLPVQENIHFTGPRNYRQLPQYLASWDIAMMPFALNESTKYISPTKTPEYLAGGKPVVSTSIRDVVNPYGNQDLVYIADTVNEFSDAIRHAIQNPGDKDWLQRVDAFLENISWDITFKEMNEQINKTWDIKKGGREPDKIQAYV